MENITKLKRFEESSKNYIYVSKSAIFDTEHIEYIHIVLEMKSEDFGTVVYQPRSSRIIDILGWDHFALFLDDLKESCFMIEFDDLNKFFGKEKYCTEYVLNLFKKYYDEAV